MNNNTFTYLEAIKRNPVQRTPIWIMRQAGRYLPEYRALREKYDFLTVCKTPELATEVTMQPLRRFDIDAAILFSDILVIPEAMGQELTFLPDHGPQLNPYVRDEAGINALNVKAITDRLSYVADAVKMIKSELGNRAPLIGFSGSPFTLAVYMIEGKPTRNYKYIKTMMYSRPDLLHKLLSKLATAVSDYLSMQVEAGADAIQVFDTWGGILPVHGFEAFSARYMAEIVHNLKKYEVPVTLFAKGNSQLLPVLLASGASMLGVDWMTDLKQARQIVGDKAALQGNLDPSALYGSHEIIAKEVSRVLSAFGADSGHVFNLGHGITPDIPVETVAFLVDEVHRQSEKIRSVQSELIES